MYYVNVNQCLQKFQKGTICNKQCSDGSGNATGNFRGLIFYVHISKNKSVHVNTSLHKCASLYFVLVPNVNKH